MKKLNITALSILLFFSFNLSAQISFDQRYLKIQNLTDSLGIQYKVKTNRLKHDLYNLALYEHHIFAAKQVDTIQLFNNYLRNLMQLVTGEKFNNYVGLFKSGEANAFVVYSGDVFYNYGLFAEAKNEASVAAILGHEYAHFYDAHIFKSIYKDKIDKHKDYYEYSKSHEYIADSLGLLFTHKAGFNWKSGKFNFYEFLDLDTIIESLRRKPGVLSLTADIKLNEYYDESKLDLFRTHPPTLKRIQKWEQWGGNLKEGEEFIVDKNMFFRLQQYCREQMLEMFLHDNNLNQGIIKALKFHLLDPTNEKYIYYLYEFTRRKVFVNEGYKSIGFLSDILNIEKNKSVFDNLRWIFRMDDDVKRVRSYVDKNFKEDLITYQDAMLYLEKFKVSNPEIYLSKALYHYQNQDLSFKYMDEYLKNENIKHRDFATNYLNNKLHTTIKELNNTYYINKGIIYYRYKIGKIKRDFKKESEINAGIEEKLPIMFYNKKNKRNHKIVTFFHQYNNQLYEDLKFVLLPYIDYINEMNYSVISLYSNNDLIYYFSPDIWAILHKLNSNQIIVFESVYHHKFIKKWHITGSNLNGLNLTSTMYKNKNYLIYNNIKYLAEIYQLQY